VDGGGADLDHKAAGHDRGWDLHHAVRKNAAEGHAPGRQRRRIAEQESRQERERKTAQAGGEGRQRGPEHEGQEVVAEDAEHLLPLRCSARGAQKARQRRLDDRTGERAGLARQETDSDAGHETGCSQRERYAPQPQQTNEARAAAKAPAERRDRAVQGLAQADVARQQRLARETRESHSKQDDGEDDHHRREAP